MARSLRDSAIRSRIAAHHEDILSKVQPVPTTRKENLLITRHDREGNLVDGWYFRPNR